MEQCLSNAPGNFYLLFEKCTFFLHILGHMVLTACATCSWSFNLLPTQSHHCIKKYTSVSIPETRARWEHSWQNYAVAITCVNFSQGYISSSSHKKLFNYLKLLAYICSHLLLISFTISSWMHAHSHRIVIIQHDKGHVRFHWANLLFNECT